MVEVLSDEISSLAACSGCDPELFFSTRPEDLEAASDFCFTQCLIQAECLELAVARREGAGVWGGFLFNNGHIVGNTIRGPGRHTSERPEWTPPLGEVPVHLRDDIYVYQESPRLN